MTTKTLDASVTRLAGIKGKKHIYDSKKIAEAEALAAEALRMANEAKLAAARLAEVKKTLAIFSSKLESAEKSVNKDSRSKTTPAVVKEVSTEKVEEFDSEQPVEAAAAVEEKAEKTESVEEEPAAEEAPVEEPAAELESVEEPAQEEIAKETPAIEEPAEEAKTVYKADPPSVSVEVVAEEAPVEEPVTEEAPVEEPAAEVETVEEPAVEEAPAAEPAVEEACATEPAVEAAAVEEPAVDEPAVEEAPVQEPVAEVETVEEPAAEVAPVEEPAAEVETVEEPVQEEIVKETPAIEKPAEEEAKVVDKVDPPTVSTNLVNNNVVKVEVVSKKPVDKVEVVSKKPVDNNAVKSVKFKQQKQKGRTDTFKPYHVFGGDGKFVAPQVFADVDDEPEFLVRVPASQNRGPTSQMIVTSSHNRDIIEDFMDSLGMDKACGLDDTTLGFTDRPKVVPEIEKNPTKDEPQTDERLHEVPAEYRHIVSFNQALSDPFGADHDDLVICGKLADLCEPPIHREYVVPTQYRK